MVIQWKCIISLKILIVIDYKKHEIFSIDCEIHGPSGQVSQIIVEFLEEYPENDLDFTN